MSASRQERLCADAYILGLFPEQEAAVDPRFGNFPGHTPVATRSAASSSVPTGEGTELGVGRTAAWVGYSLPVTVSAASQEGFPPAVTDGL